MRILRTITFLAFALVALGAAVLLGPAQLGLAQSPSLCPHCETDSFPPNIPLNDLGPGTYANPSATPGTTPVQGGLYPDGYNQRPAAHNNRGIRIARNNIVPRNKDTGQPDPDGKIVMISIGMCNTTIEFGGTNVGAQYGFESRATNDLAKRDELVVVDCAKAGQDAKKWADGGPPDQDPHNPWTYLDSKLTNAGVSRKQVQVVWLKEALIDPEKDRHYGVWPTHAIKLQGFLEQILDHLVSSDYGFENVKMVFLSPRTRAWTTNHDPGFTHSPEPDAYETGFADKWVIAEQGLHQNWPWLSWGPYLWANGDIPRSDGLTWPCAYVQSDDCVHPVVDGVKKVVDQLLAFFKTDPVATPWFVRAPDAGHAPMITSATAMPNSGTVPFSVQFHAEATAIVGEIHEYAWTYDDGDYGYGADPPVKSFKAPSVPNKPYQVHLTVIDTEGNAAFRDISVTAATPTPGPRRLSSAEDTKHRPAPVPRPEQGAAWKVATQPVKSAGGNVLGNHR